MFKDGKTKFKYNFLLNINILRNKTIKLFEVFVKYHKFHLESINIIE